MVTGPSPTGIKLSFLIENHTHIVPTYILPADSELTFSSLPPTMPGERARSGSPYSRRSQSPKSPTTVSLIQNRLREKISRSNSDLASRPTPLQKRHGLSAINASRIIGSSHNASLEKLRVSSPDLMSPREVKKVMEKNGSTHKLSLTLETRDSSGQKKLETLSLTHKSPGGSYIVKKTGTGSPIKSNNGKSKTVKSVKISEKVSVQNGGEKPTTSAAAPVKPPRKGVTVGKSKENICNANTSNGNKVTKVSKIGKNVSYVIAPSHSGSRSPSNNGGNTTPTNRGSSVEKVSSGATTPTMKRGGSVEKISQIPVKKINANGNVKKEKTNGKKISAPSAAKTVTTIKKDDENLEKTSKQPGSDEKLNPAETSECAEQSFTNTPYGKTNNLGIGYMTIPLRRKERQSVKLPIGFYRDTISYGSLPALTPYLKETKRVSNSAFLLSMPTVPFVKHTKTSVLREQLSNNPHLDPKGLVRSLSCIGLREKLLRDYNYTSYILELQHARKRSARFMQLHNLYSSLERLGALEKSTSLYNIPIMSVQRQVDFEAWWKVRNRLRVEEEMSAIANKLLVAQKNREFFFQPKELEKFRWKGDSALRIKNKSVHELKDILRLEDKLTKSALDLHKATWRGTSVKETALNLEVASIAKNSDNSYYYSSTSSLNREYLRTPGLRRAFSMSSTLSDDQRQHIKSRLGTLIQKKEEDEENKSNMDVNKRDRSPVYVRTTPMGGPPSFKQESQFINVDGTLSESAKRQLSKTVSDELKDKKEKGILDPSANVLTVPSISTRLKLKKLDESEKLKKQRAPAFSVYCKQGVNSKVSYFEKRQTCEPERKSVSLTFHPQSATHPDPGKKSFESPNDQYMSHINIISKLASVILKRDDTLKKLVQKELIEQDKLARLRFINSGEVERLTSQFEAKSSDFPRQREIALLRCLFCSDQNLARITEEKLTSSGKSSRSCSPVHTRRCKSADMFKPKDQSRSNEGKNRSTRLKPDGKESSPVHSRSPEFYLTTRSRKPIYEPSTAPNVCQPTLTSRSYLDSPCTMEMMDGYTSSDSNIWACSSPSLRACSPDSFIYSSIPPRILDSRMSKRNWNVDPTLHTPKSRYVPPPPVVDDSGPPPVPFRSRKLTKSMSLNTYPYLYRSVSYWPKEMGSDQTQNKREAYYTKLYYYYGIV